MIEMAAYIPAWLCPDASARPGSSVMASVVPKRPRANHNTSRQSVPRTATNDSCRCSFHPANSLCLVLESDRSRNANKEDLSAYLVLCRTPTCTSQRFGHSSSPPSHFQLRSISTTCIQHLYRPLPLHITVHHDFLLKSRARCHVESCLGSYQLFTVCVLLW